MYDYHLHTHISYDGRMSMEEMLDAAISKGLKEVCLTEHLDIPLNGKLEDAQLNMAAYNIQIEALRTKAPICVKQGIEMGVHKELMEEYQWFADNTNFDFVICSQHIVDNQDPYFPQFFDTHTVRECYELYFEDIIASITSFKKYNVLGHIGYVSRYHSNYEKLPFTYQNFGDYADAIFRILIEEGKGLEINTSCMGTPIGPNPPVDMLKRYKELGGEIITTGSDAHEAKNVGNHFHEAYAVLKEIGFCYVCTFDNMQPMFHKI